MKHSKCESESGPGSRHVFMHFSFRAFSKEYSNFESVSITMFKPF